MGRSAVRKIFIDGESGTTGLQVRQRLRNHDGIEILSIDPADRRDPAAKSRIMQIADVTVLCLPDDAARESAALAATAGCRVLDASSAHRTSDDWVYGLAELAPRQRAAIAGARQVANPGCYPTGVILLMRPLLAAGLLPRSGFYTVNAVSGYSGGGKSMIERYEEEAGTPPCFAAYGLDFSHKHLPEIQHWSGLLHHPVFVPSVGNYAQGMLIFIPVRPNGKISPRKLHSELERVYRHERFVRVLPLDEIAGGTAPFITPHGLENTNLVELSVFGAPDQQAAVLVARLDNLGKGASGAAVQNLNLMLGFPEHLGVDLP
ncbi:N-acetyl-gamma-glutamyl-phosphate reductase [Marinobacterium sp. D7]|uniref:N-acetyl-gamma-glutamyl-phosphate reductase n=1 Tax=Marinobacterium ramblicola TaxID=2849041 RepID=UPI001C2D1116|nr:N-acetyl-gamma-glutamyl-phosphate reductase [Marinobacterium ramblicola]MBV1790783.1 N-acetyl-gamma-glutamyl-phosphate reductase [Marinobacterium ramblicola]